MSLRGKRGRHEEADEPVINLDDEASTVPPMEDGVSGRWSLTRKLSGVLAFVLLIGLVGAGGFYLISVYSDLLGPGDEMAPQARVPSLEAESRSRAISGDYTVLELYYPVGGRLVREERSVPRATSVREIASAVVNEFLSGPSGGERGVIPEEARLDGVYYGNDLVLYIDFNDALRRNFQGNAEEEYLLLKALNMSLMSNVFQVEGIKLLVDGKELDSLGGHLSVRGLLGEAVSFPVREAHDG
jgi:hypothetical protein